MTLLFYTVFLPNLIAQAFLYIYLYLRRHDGRCKQPTKM